MKVVKKSKVGQIPKYNSHSGFSKVDWNSLNSGKSIEVDVIPEVAKQFVEAVKKGK